ncbi:MAG: pentapeptide repeat-containing protein [Clostridiales bacterium]
MTDFNQYSADKKKKSFVFEEHSAKYVDSIFSEIKLHSFDLSYSKFYNCEFHNCSFEFGNLISTTFENCKFRNVVFDKCSLSNSVLTEVEFISGNFLFCGMDRLKMKDSIFLKAKITNSDFSYSEIRNCNLSNNKIMLSIFDETLLENVDFFKLFLIDCITRKVVLENPKNLMWTREFISALLHQHSEGLMKREQIAELVKFKKSMCWDAWQRFADDEEPMLVDWVKTSFSLYPESKLIEALNNEISFIEN